MFKWGQKTAWTALLVIVMMGLTACGMKDSNSSEGATPTIENQQPNTTASEDTVKESTTRTVTDEFGEVTIPTHPKRVVGIYLEDYLKALGVTPVVQWYHPSWGKQDYLNLDVPKFDISGSIEALLEKNPDLIIVDGGIDEQKYELYSKVAPTYRLKENILNDPKEVLKAISSVLGISEKADSVLAEYDQKVVEGKAKLEQSVGKEKVAVIRLNVADKALALFGIKNRFIGVIYKEFGLEPIDMAANMTDYQAVISKELIPDLDADHLIVFPDNGTWDDVQNQEAYKELLEGPLWKDISAIKNGNVYKMERSHWQTGAIMANSMKLDDLLKVMAK